MGSESMDPADQAAGTGELVAYLRTRSEDIGLLLARRYREEIVEYRSLPAGFIEQDIAPTARRNFEDVLSGLSPNDPEVEIHLQEFRDSAIRRFQQGVPIQALLHAYRLWGHTVWEEVQKAPQAKANPAAALVIAGRIMKHVDLVSTTVAQAYLQRASGFIHDREMVRRDLIEALIAGNAPERVASYAPAYKISDEGRYFVVLLRQRPGAPASTPGAMRDSLALVEREIAGTSAPIPLAVVRGEEVVAVCHADHGSTVDLRQQANVLAALLGNYLLGVGRPHDGIAGIARSYVDAQDAVLTALSVADTRPRAYMFADALVEHVVRASAFRDDLDREAVAPLRAYDEAHRADLIPTLRSYIDAGFSLAQAAAELQIQPNTVKYRLQRIQNLTGYNPLDPRDVLLFALALMARA